MPNNWKTYKLDDVANVVDSLHKTPKYSDFGFPMVRAQEILGGTLDISKTAKVSKEVYEDFSKNHKSQIGDLVFSRVGAHCGKVSYVDTNVPFCLGQNTVFILPESIDNKFLYFMISSSVVQSQLTRNAVVSSYKTISLKTLRELELNLPPLPEQKAIANILSAIDDKIENNLAINKTLEDMAMALYKHWFVDFGPFQDGEFIDSELGPIPKGWEVKRLDEFCTLTMGQSPKSEFYNQESNGLPFHQGVKDYGERFPNDETYSTEGKRLAEEGDVLFSVRAPVGRLNIAKNKIILGRGLASIRMNDFNHFGFLFYALNTRFTEDDIIGDGTVYKSVNKSELQNLQFLIPTKSIIQDFNQLVKPNDEKYLNNFKENQSLSQLRDTLLPKLISGEVRLKEFQDVIANAVKQSHET